MKLQDGEGMLQIAIRTDTIEELADKFSKYGLQTIGPFEGKRMRKDTAFRMENVICKARRERTEITFLYTVE